MALEPSDSRESKRCVVPTEFDAKGFHDQFVIGALRQSGDGHCGDQACLLHADREAATVTGVVDGRKATGFEAGLFLFEIEADGVRTAEKTEDDVAFAADPIGIVRSGAGECSVKERLVGAAHVDDDRQNAFRCHDVQAGADVPRGLFGEFRKDEIPLLQSDAGQVVGNRHR